jgi:hypothetical protein
MATSGLLQPLSTANAGCAVPNLSGSLACMAQPAGVLGANFTTPPNLGVNPGSPTSGTLTQGAALPNITTTQTQATAAPTFYTDYLNQLAKQGACVAQNAQYVGATPLQTQAFNLVAQNQGNYANPLCAATTAATNVAGQCLAKLATCYMKHSYTNCVVNAIGNLGQANIANNLAPQATAGIIGSGQFGSARGAGALGQVLANAALGINAQQACALFKGENAAFCAAARQQTNQLAAANQLGNLATTTQNLGLGDVNALATLGGQQQTIQQNKQLFPMQQLSNEAQLLRGFTMPTSTASSYTGPIPGAYAASPLQQIAGLGALAAGISKTPLGAAIGSKICQVLSGKGAKATQTTGATGGNQQSMCCAEHACCQCCYCVDCGCGCYTGF